MPNTKYISYMRLYYSCVMRSVIIILSLLLSYHRLPAQLVDTTMTIDELVGDILLGNGVSAGNIKYTGGRHAIGYVRDSSAQLGIEHGILLTSGHILLSLGPNKSPRVGWASNLPGDVELDDIARGKTYDASVLEFDFVTASENLSFEFVFASEEYLEYVGSQFNDVFAFFIEGPDLPKVNIARLPDGVTPITVNSVNNELNSQFYIDNTYINTTDPFVWDVRNRKVVSNRNYQQPEVPPKYHTQFDGFTTVLKAQCKVTPNKVYHIKIAISDVGDGILDSGVILKGGSFLSYGDQVVSIDDHFEKRIEPRLVERLSSGREAVEKSIKYRMPGDRVLGNIEFDFDRYSLPNTAGTTLSNVLDEWQKSPQHKIYIVGHTDNFGSDDYNLHLSSRRSNTVARALKKMGIPADQLIIQYFGEKKPIKSNTTPVGRARNRRVEMVIGD